MQAIPTNWGNRRAKLTIKSRRLLTTESVPSIVCELVTFVNSLEDVVVGSVCSALLKAVFCVGPVVLFVWPTAEP